MDSINETVLAEQLIGLNLDIKTNFFCSTRFQDSSLEKLFNENQEKKSKFQIILSDLMLVAGYATSLLYILIAFYQIIFIASFSIFFAICLILMYNKHY